jgi:WD40 repeat protein
VLTIQAWGLAVLLLVGSFVLSLIALIQRRRSSDLVLLLGTLAVAPLILLAGALHEPGGTRQRRAGYQGVGSLTREAAAPGSLGDARPQTFDLAPLRGIGGILWRLDGPAVGAVSFSPDGGRLAAVCADGVLRLWDTRDGKAVRSYSQPDGKFRCVAFSSDGGTLAGGTDGATIHLWDTATGERRSLMKSAPDSVRCLCFSPSGRTLITLHNERVGRMAGSEFGIRMWDTGSGQMIGSPHPQIQGLSLSMDPARRRLYVGRINGISVVDADTGDLLNLRDIVLMLGLDAYGIAVSPDNQFLVAAQQWGGVGVFDPMTLTNKTGFQIGERRYRTDAPNVMAFSPAGSLLACGTGGDTAHLWSVGSWQLVRLIHPNGSYVAFSADGARLATAGAKGLEIRDVRATVLHRPTENGLVNVTGYWQGGPFARLYLKGVGKDLTGWWEGPATGTNRASLKGDSAPSKDASGNTVLEWTWRLDKELGVGRIVADAERQTLSLTRWRGNLRHGRPLDTATLSPIL